MAPILSQLAAVASPPQHAERRHLWQSAAGAVLVDFITAALAE
jgi:hypothetical protein